MRRYLFLVLFLFSFNFVFATQIEGSTQVSFSTAGWSCVSNSASASWSFTNETMVTPIILPVVNASGSVGNCSKYAIENNNRACCPTNNVCSMGNCSVTNNYDQCYKITSRDACDSASADIGTRSVEGKNGNPVGICGKVVSYSLSGQSCANVTLCGCSWDSSTSKCVASRNDKYNCSGTTTTKTCNWVAGEPQNHCGDDLSKIIVDYNVTGTAVGTTTWCNPTSEEYPCAVSVKLPFFDLFNFAIVSMGIAIGYLFFRKK